MAETAEAAQERAAAAEAKVKELERRVDQLEKKVDFDKKAAATEATLRKEKEERLRQTISTLLSKIFPLSCTFSFCNFFESLLIFFLLSFLSPGAAEIPAEAQAPEDALHLPRNPAARSRR